MESDEIELSNTLKVSLKEYIESRFIGIEKAAAAARTELERRLNELNKLREEVIADRTLYVTREVFDRLHERVQSDVNKLQATVLAMQTTDITLASSRQSTTAMRITIVGFVLTVLQLGQGILLYVVLHK